MQGFLTAGAHVAALDIAGLDQFQNESNVHGFKCDITKEEEVDAVIDAVKEKWGHIDILVNNAGVMDSFGMYRIRKLSHIGPLTLQLSKHT